MSVQFHQLQQQLFANLPQLHVQHKKCHDLQNTDTKGKSFKKLLHKNSYILTSSAVTVSKQQFKAILKAKRIRSLRPITHVKMLGNNEKHPLDHKTVKAEQQL